MVRRVLHGSSFSVVRAFPPISDTLKEVISRNGDLVLAANKADQKGYAV
jgi:hypothetical protein